MKSTKCTIRTRSRKVVRLADIEIGDYVYGTVGIYKLPHLFLRAYAEPPMFSLISISDPNHTFDFDASDPQKTPDVFDLEYVDIDVLVTPVED